MVVRLIDQIEKRLQGVIRSDGENQVSPTAKIKAAVVEETFTVQRDFDCRHIFSDRSRTYGGGGIGIIERIPRRQINSDVVLLQPGIVKIDFMLAFTR